MVNIVPVLASVVFLIGILFLISVVTSPQQQTQLQKVYNDIAFPNGDHIQFYQQAQQYVTVGAAQLSTTPSLPWKLMGIDSHNNVIAQNTATQQIINATAGTTQANQILSTTSPTTPPPPSTYITSTGSNYMTGSSTSSPTQTATCTRGHTCTIAGKIIILNQASCKTSSGCTNLSGPFRYTIQIICVDSNPYRCSYLSGVLPTFRGETDTNGLFSYNWTPASDAYYVGNYIARLYAETESATINGPTVSETGDYPIVVY